MRVVVATTVTALSPIITAFNNASQLIGQFEKGSNIMTLEVVDGGAVRGRNITKATKRAMTGLSLLMKRFKGIRARPENKTVQMRAIKSGKTVDRLTEKKLKTIPETIFILGFHR